MKPGVDSEHLLIAAQERAAGGQQDQCDGDLRCNEPGAQPRMVSAGRSRARRILESVGNVCVGGRERGQQARQYAGGESEQQREERNSCIDCDRVDARQRIRQKPQSRTQHKRCKTETEEGSSKTEHEPFEKRFANDRRRPRAESEADSGFTAAANSADEHKDRDVDAGDEQDD